MVPREIQTSLAGAWLSAGAASVLLVVLVILDALLAERLPL